MIGSLVYFRHRTRDRWIRGEADKWLAERIRQTNPQARLWRKRLQRRVLWVPSAVALMVFLFFPETTGFASHMFCGRFIHLGEYRINTPLTWIVASRDDSSAWVIATKGIGRTGFRTYWRKEAPVSEMVFHISSDPAPPTSEWYLAHARVLSKQTLQFGPEKLTCLDIVAYAETRPVAMSPDLAEILCSSERNDIGVNFVGQRSDSSDFYEVLQSAARAN